MKKRTAILLSGTLLGSMACYVAWCFRPFYLPPPLDHVGDVSRGGREALADWRWSAGYPRPLDFQWSIAWKNLCHPWDCEMGAPVRAGETPGIGLWATTPDDDRWGFSKLRNEWNASTAFHHGNFPVFSHSPASGMIDRQGEIASRIDSWGAGGATLEILTLGPLTTHGRLARQAGLTLGSGIESPDFFCDHVVLGRLIVSEPRERQDLLDALARSIREADVEEAGLPRWSSTPRLGIILTHGGQRAEYLASFEEGDGYGFEEALADIGGFEEDHGFLGCSVCAGTAPYRGPVVIAPHESAAYFRLSPAYRGVFEAILDKHGIPR